MKKLGIAILSLIASAASAQTTGDFLFQKKRATTGFEAQYLTPSAGDSGLFGVGPDGNAKLYDYPIASGGVDFGTAAAFVRYDGNDGTGEVGNPSLPYATIDAAISALTIGGQVVSLDPYPTITGSPLSISTGMTYAIVYPPGTQMSGNIAVSAGTQLYMSGGVLFGDLTITGGAVTVEGTTINNVWMTAGGTFNAGSSVIDSQVSSDDSYLTLRGCTVGVGTSIMGTGTANIYGTTSEGISIFDASTNVYLDRVTAQSLNNSASGDIAITAYNTVTTTDTVGDGITVVGYGNCFGCTGVGPQGPEGPQGPQGPQGDPGATGATGAAGADGEGVPTGGTAGQVLAKVSGTDYDTEWVDQSGGSTPTLAEVLWEDSVTGGNNIVVESGDAIAFRGSTGNSVRLITETLSGDKVQVLQDVSGYIATLGDIDYRLGLLGIEDLAGGPGSLTGNALRYLRVNGDASAVEWSSISIPSPQNLSDVLSVGNTSGSYNIIVDPTQGVAFRAAAGVGATAITGPVYTDAVYTATLQAADGTIAYTSDIPSNATYITQTAHAGLSNEQALSSLSTGIVKVTTGTGVLSTATAGDFPTLNQSTTGSAATLTTSRTFQTNLASTSAAGFNGSANNSHGVTGTLPVTNGGTGRATSTTAYGLIAAGTTATGAHQTLATGTSGQTLVSGGSAALPTWQTPVARSVGVMPMNTSFYAWSNMPSAETFFNAQGRWVYPLDLTNATMIRVVVTMPNPGALPANGAKIRIKYKTEASGFSTTIGDYSSLAASGQVEATMSNAMGVYSSSWTAIAAGAKTTVILAVSGVDGDGAADPQFGSITIDYY